MDASFDGADGTPLNGVRTYKTVGAALRAPLSEGTGEASPYTVLVRNGRYHEKLAITRPFTALIGESRDGTVLTYDAAAGVAAPGGAPTARAAASRCASSPPTSGPSASRSRTPSTTRRTRPSPIPTRPGSATRRRWR